MKSILRGLFARAYFMQYSAQLSRDQTGSSWTIFYLWPWQSLVDKIERLKAEILEKYPDATDFCVSSIHRT